MTSSIRLGRLFGIPIGLHYSWLVIFFWFTWILATSVFPNLNEDWTEGQYWGVAIASSLLFFASIVAHELGHSLVAMRYGIQVKSITLFILGGVAQIAKEAPRARIEGLIAAAGPAVSIGLGGLFLGLHALTEDVNEQVSALSLYLGQANIFVGIFNLLPGFPMDGGRILRAIVWGIGGNLLKATRIATTLGKGMGILLIAAGIAAVIFTGSLLSGIGAVLIGWFIFNAASQSYTQATLREALRGIRVREIMSAEPALIPGRLDLRTLVQSYVVFSGRTTFFVGEDGRLDGLLTLENIKATPRERWAETTVSDVKTPLEEIATITPGEELVTALEAMDESRAPQLPVVDRGAVVGIVNRDQILQLATRRAELGLHA